MGPIPSFLSALVSSAILSLGMILQKRHVAFIGHKGKHDKAFVRDRGGWILGFTLVNLAPPFNYLALLGLPTNVVAGIAGSSVAFAAIFSALILGERITTRQVGLTVALFCAIALAGLRGTGAAKGDSPDTAATWLFIIIPFIAGGAALVLRAFRGKSLAAKEEAAQSAAARGPKTAKRRKTATSPEIATALPPGRARPAWLAVAIGAIAGSMGGFMLVPLKLLGFVDPTIAAWLGAPWLWLYIAAGIASFAIVQLAYKDGAMNRVAPAFYGLQVLWPALASLFVFSLAFDPLQWLAFAAIGVCVILIAAGEKA
ncbi:MAG TPA: hypothetical protein VMV44_07135 [Rectinemataceae bacterium]|nr:hypothetical protein [Rectinemataceae bacterium]